MIYLYGDESNTPGADLIWGIGFLFSTNPSKHMANVRKIRKECSYEYRELKYASTDYSQILFKVRFIDYFLSAKDVYFKIIIKDNIFANKDYFAGNHYGLDKKTWHTYQLMRNYAVQLSLKRSINKKIIEYR